MAMFIQTHWAMEVLEISRIIFISYSQKWDIFYNDMMKLIIFLLKFWSFTEIQLRNRDKKGYVELFDKFQTFESIPFTKYLSLISFIYKSRKLGHSFLTNACLVIKALSFYYLIL